ncbi:MAG TPA: hypothetical protein VF039_03695, partial [Longimicrobiales bacterium]
GTLITMSAAACGEDTPLDEGVGEVEQLQFDRGFASVAPGDTITFSVAPRDQFGSPVAQDVEFEVCDNKITLGDVRPDSAELFPRTIVEVIGTDNLGYSCIVASAGGVTDSVTVLVVPPYLLTDVASAEGGDTITFVRSLGQPAFDGDTRVTMQIQAPPPGDFIHSVFVLREQSTADSLVVVLPINAAAGDYVFEVTDIGAGQATIGADFTVTAQGTAGVDIDNPNGDATTDTVIVTDLPYEVVSEVTQEESNDWYRITVDEAGVLDMSLQWDYGNNGADFIALYLYNAPNTVAVEPRLVLTYAAAPDPADLHAQIELAPGNYWVRVRNLDGEHTPTSYYLHLFMAE